jgi:hypothetical protein
MQAMTENRKTVPVTFFYSKKLSAKWYGNGLPPQYRLILQFFTLPPVYRAGIVTSVSFVPPPFVIDNRQNIALKTVFPAGNTTKYTEEENENCP